MDIRKEKIKAVIIDDEINCISNLKYYLERFCPEINVVATGSSITEAISIFETEDIDIAFLDVEVFDENIFTAIKAIGRTDFKIVFVTAYESYALQAFKVEALDYMLKPLNEQDIISCYDKIIRQFYQATGVDAQTSAVEVSGIDSTLKKVILRQAGKLYVIRLCDIVYIKAKGFYTIIYFVFNGEEKTVTISKPIKFVEEQYTNDIFYRIHKSYIINLQKISEIIKTEQLAVKMSGYDELITVSRRKANDFLSIVNRT